MNSDHVKTLDIIASLNETMSPIINAATAQIKDIQKNFKLDSDLNDRICTISKCGNFMASVSQSSQDSQIKIYYLD